MPQMEQVLNKPLSGSEVRKIILADLDRILATDSRLSDFIAFPSFQYKLDLAIVLTGAVEPHDKINREMTGGRGDVTSDPNLPASIVTHHAERDPQPPNQVRMEAGLGVPVLTRDERGREIEREVKYGQPVENRAKQA